MKLSVSAIKQFFVEHGEKIGFGIVCLFCLMFVYSAATHETLAPANEPDRLREVSERAQQNVANSKWDQKQIATTSIDFVSRARREPVVATNYAPHSVINPPIFQPPVKRGRPQALPVEELLAASGFGVFALNGGPASQHPVVAAPAAPAPKSNKPANPKAKPLRTPAARPGTPTAGPVPIIKSPPPTTDDSSRQPGIPVPSGATLELERWAVVTGLVPIKKQIAEFDRALEGTLGSLPAQQLGYVGFKIERAEVTSPGDQNLHWEPLDLRDVDAFVAKWTGAAPDIVAPEYVSPQFTMALGPLIGVDWEESATHPKVPLAPKASAAGGPSFAAPGQNIRRPDSSPTAARRAAGQPSDGGGAGFGGFGSGSPALGGPQSPVAGASGSQGGEQRGQIDYYLFRFFDFTVKPGTRYRYRVQLGLNNPNYAVPARYLKDPESAKEELLSAAWSEPTPVVTISEGTSRLVAGPVKIIRGGEPAASVVVSTVPADHQFEVLAKEEVQRGSVANFTEKKVAILDPASKEVSHLDDLNFATNDVVVDIHGGRDLALDSHGGRTASSKDKTETEPGEILILDSTGQLIVRDEIADHDLFKSYDAQKREIDRLKK